MRRWLPVFVMAAACGGGDDGEAFLGTYMVTAHTWDVGQGGPISCGAPGTPVTDGDPYVALIVDPFFDDPSAIRLQTCGTTAAADCVDELTLFAPGGPGLVHQAASTQTSGGITSCGLYAWRDIATLTGDVLRVELRQWNDYVELPASQCTPARAEEMIATDSCYEVEIWDAVRTGPVPR